MSGTLADTLPQAQQLYLWPLCWDSWQAAGSLRRPLAEFADYPVPSQSPDAELRWWDEQVETGRVLVFGLFDRHNDGLLGTLKAFDFSPDRSRCEIGIEILDQADYGRGLGREGVGLWLGYLAAQGVNSVYGLIHPDNRRSRRLFARLGFSETGIEADPHQPSWTFVRVEKQLA